MTTTPMMMTLAEAQAMLPESTRVGDWLTPVARVHTDTRTLKPGDLFVALKGERFDAHDFLAAARAAGAAAVLSSRPIDGLGLPGLVVADTLVALQTLALEWRKRFILPLIAVTGSNGKTTVTQMIGAILRDWLRHDALVTAGNLNNHIGVPLTLLALRDTHRAAVVELGMNHPGEIALLSALALPNVALVNNAQREHQEFMASVEAVARENGGVIDALGPTGAAVFPADDPHTPLWRAIADRRPVLTFSLRDAAADIRGRASWTGAHWALELQTPVGDAPVMLRAPGEHNLHNALAAAACALAAGASLAHIRAGLEAFEPVKGRSRVVALPGGGTLVDDSYNANPDSVRAAIDLLATLPAPRWLVLGDMGEVGARGPEFHREVGEHAAAAGIDELWCAGELCRHAASGFGPMARHFASVEALLAELRAAPAFATALVKGSRFMKMERVVEALQQRGRGDAA
jgi:UDP-N-acetylmuramoyl-tripeptide--D-alanyl-D-alanine ligase